MIFITGLGAISCDVWQYPELQANGVLSGEFSWLKSGIQDYEKFLTLFNKKTLKI